MTRPIPDLITAYHQGDAAAQQELLERLETQLRGLVRALLGKQIRTERESLDVCQSLLLAFHLQAKQGKVKIESEEALRGYLRAMIRHKLANLSDRIRTAKR
ncbi:MAG: ECF-type sigma factor, partial [Planctomycetota bacterium]